MTDKASDGLPYGHFGAAFYDAEERQWAFTRDGRLSHSFGPIGNPTWISQVDDKASSSITHFGSKKPSSKRREKQVKTLIQSLPEVQPAADLLPELVRVSEAIEEASSRHDSATGRLIAIGKVYDESRRGYVDAMAFPHGPTRSDVRIVQGIRQREGWEEDTSSWLETMRFTGEEAVWQGPGASVLSIVFAQPLEAGVHYLAVRIPTETRVFRPVLRKRPSSGGSRMELDMLFSVGIKTTGGMAHADLAFNPWFTGHLAVVNSAGAWSVWETGRKSRQARRIKSRAQAHDDAESSARPLDDGWARVVWVESSSTICIATRSDLTLIDLDATGQPPHVAIDVGLTKLRGWILGIDTVQTHLDHLFIVTTSHVLIHRIMRDSTGQLWSQALVARRHHRNPEDVSLRMSIAASDSYVIITLWSAFHQSVQQIWVDFSNGEHPRMQQPQTLHMPGQTLQCDSADLRFQVVPCTNANAAFGASSLPEHWRLYRLGKDMALSHTFCAARDTQRLLATASAPSWTKLVMKAPKNMAASGTDQTDADKVRGLRAPTSAYVTARRHSALSRSAGDWTVSYELLARKINASTFGFDIDVDEVIEEISSIIQTQTSATCRPMRSFCEIAGGDVHIQDVDGASKRLDALSSIEGGRKIKLEDVDDSQESHGSTLVASSIAHNAALRELGLGCLSTLSDAISELSVEWAGPAESIMTANLQEAREAQARRMAADVTLASRVLRIASNEREENTATQTQSQSQARELPLRQTSEDDDSQGAKTSQPATQPLQPAALPTPSASASTITGSSYPLKIPAPEIARLSKYTSFTKPAPSALPRALNKVLAHWTVSTNPTEYDWRATSRQISRHDEEAEGDEMTEKERKQMQRRTERYVRRQRREAEESQRMQMLSSQAPEIVSASQPAQRRAESQVPAAGAGPGLGSSQSYAIGQSHTAAAASQVVPGRHGGRPPARKKRKSGF